MTNADFNKPLPKLGPDANYGDVIYILVTHAHEHLGQSIAYARMNGVVPPWTAAAEAAAKAKNKPRQKISPTLAAKVGALLAAPLLATASALFDGALAFVILKSRRPARDS